MKVSEISEQKIGSMSQEEFKVFVKSCIATSLVFAEEGIAKMDKELQLSFEVTECSSFYSLWFKWYSGKTEKTLLDEETGHQADGELIEEKQNFHFIPTERKSKVIKEISRFIEEMCEVEFKELV